MKRLFLVFILISIFNFACVRGQATQKDELDSIFRAEPDRLFQNLEPDRLASFPGGTKELIKWIQSNLKSLNNPLIEEGTVMVGFIIEKDGSTSNATIVKGINPYCDQIVIDLVGRFPKWTPAYYKNQPVRTKYGIPVSFQSTKKSGSKKQRKEKAVDTGNRE